MTRFEKDYRRLCRNIYSLSAGQARVDVNNVFRSSKSKERDSSEDDSSDSSEYSSSATLFYLEITPNDGPYAQGSFIFRIEVREDCSYPESPPIVSCLTRIYHPNIDTQYKRRHNNVCVSTLDDWNSNGESTLEDLVQGLLFLFYSPNCDDPLTSDICSDESEFLVKVRTAIEGGSIPDFEGTSFPVNYGYEKYLTEQLNNLSIGSSIEEFDQVKTIKSDQLEQFFDAVDKCATDSTQPDKKSLTTL